MAGATMGGVESDGDPLPLPRMGLSSVVELAAQRDKLTADQDKADFEQAFRLTFTMDRAKRDTARAKALLDGLATRHPTHAGTFRTRGYVHINSGFNVDAALADYERAVELDPAYGEAHYALAFTYAIRDKALGRAHFDKAMALGIADERGLKQQFYQDAP